MKVSHRYPHLRIYNPMQSELRAVKIEGRLSQKTLDIATILVSVAGLLTAALFLATMV